MHALCNQARRATGGKPDADKIAIIIDAWFWTPKFRSLTTCPATSVTSIQPSPVIAFLIGEVSLKGSLMTTSRRKLPNGTSPN